MWWEIGAFVLGVTMPIIGAIIITIMEVPNANY